MTPASRLQAAVDILAEIFAADRPADGVVAAYFRGRRYVGAKDRKAIAHQVWRILRNRARLAWALAADHATPRLLVLADLIAAEGKTVDGTAAHFSGKKHEPDPLTDYERRTAKRVEKADFAAAPRAVRLELPEWLLAKFDRAFGADADKELAALGEEAALDLRANTLKVGRDELRTRFVEEGIDAAATPYAPAGLRLAARLNLGSHKGFRDGLFEVQDEASQLCALLVDAKPGMAVLDLCAGAGGKTLAIAAAMGNKGRIVACDVSVPRLERSKLRLRRTTPPCESSRTTTSGSAGRRACSNGSWSMRRAPAPAPGGATPTPAGGWKRRTSSPSRPPRTRCSTRPRRW
jgi:16S rRNA (cytosine967-C5)-methyltransferase